MRTFFSKLNFIFTHLDLFPFGINLRLKKFDKTTTTLGKLMTLGILIFIGYLILTSDLLNKTNPIVMTQEIEITSRPLITLNENNFTFILAISDEIGNNYIPDPTYFTIEILSLEYESVSSAVTI